MAHAVARWERRHIGPRLSTLLFASAALWAIPAQAADQQILAVVAPTVGVAADGSPGGNGPLQVTRHWQGATLVVTVAAR